MDKHLVEISKFLSYILRHEPQAIGIELDREGWTDIDALIAAAGKAGRPLDLALIQAVVASNDKKRFALSDDGHRIRAVQGHSSQDVAIQYSPRIPPAVLYHGTASRFLEAILREGLRPGQRHYVHLSADISTASSVGQRHGAPVVLQIDALGMHRQGLPFYQADNGVWLTERVPAFFLSPITSEATAG